MLEQGERRDLLEPAGEDGRTTLGQLCAELGPLLVEVATAPGGIDLPVRGVALQDVHEPLAEDEGPGLLLLAVGAGAGDPSLLPFVAAAGAAGAAAVACRAGSWPGELLEAAETAGVALLSVPAEVAWGELYELAKAAIAIDERGGEEPTDGAPWRGLTDLFAIAEATAAIAGGPVTIDDMHSRILAFSGGADIDEGRRLTILNRRVPEHWQKEMRERGMTEHLLTSDEVLHVNFARADLEPRRAIAIRLGESVIGSIWLAGDDETLSPDADEALRRAAPIAALQMMRQRVGVSVERRMRESRVATLLQGGDATARGLERVGLRPEDDLLVVAIDVVSRSASSPAAAGTRLIDLVAMHLQAYEPPAVATSLDERVFVLAGSRGEGDRAALRRMVETCAAHAAKALGLELAVGVGHEVAAAEDLELARRSAEDCLALRPGAGVVGFEEVRDQALLGDVDGFLAAWRGGPSPTYRELAELDAANGTEYVRTLRCLLEAFGNANLAAERLHLHVNTVRYRLKRIQEITGVDFEDGPARLALELELRRGPAAP